MMLKLDDIKNKMLTNRSIESALCFSQYKVLNGNFSYLIVFGQWKTNFLCLAAKKAEYVLNTNNKVVLCDLQQECINHKEAMLIPKTHCLIPDVDEQELALPNQDYLISTTNLYILEQKIFFAYYNNFNDPGFDYRRTLTYSQMYKALDILFSNVKNKHYCLKRINKHAWSDDNNLVYCDLAFFDNVKKLIEDYDHHLYVFKEDDLQALAKQKENYLKKQLTPDELENLTISLLEIIEEASSDASISSYWIFERETDPLYYDYAADKYDVYIKLEDDESWALSNKDELLLETYDSLSKKEHDYLEEHKALKKELFSTELTKLELRAARIAFERYHDFLKKAIETAKAQNKLDVLKFIEEAQQLDFEACFEDDTLSKKLEQNIKNIEQALNIKLNKKM